MPYIKQDIREYFNKIQLDKVTDLGLYCRNSGELNYIITSILKGYLSRSTKSYSVLNEIIGVIECVKLEFSRRIVSPYEDEAIDRNGDVF